MICSCGSLMTTMSYARTEPGEPREVRPCERCPECGRIHWLAEWTPQTIEQSKGNGYCFA